jgi:hypothetical protein
MIGSTDHSQAQWGGWAEGTVNRQTAFNFPLQ